MTSIRQGGQSACTRHQPAFHAALSPFLDEIRSGSIKASTPANRYVWGGTRICGLFQMTSKWFVLLFAFTAVGVMSGAAAQDGAPPHAPNFCTPGLCLEVAPLPQPEQQRFVTPIFFTNDSGGTKRIRISYGTLGDIIVTLSALSDARGDPIFVNKPCAEGESCVQGTVTAEGALGKASDDLKCQIRMIWVMRPGYRVVQSGDISETVAYTIATKRNGSTCVGFLD